MKKENARNGWKYLTTVLCATLLSACGGGGGGSDAPSAPIGAQPSTPAPISGSTVTGAVTKGPVAGATVVFYEVDGLGFQLDAPVATTTTDSNGLFSVTIPEGTGVLMVESQGGSFVDESDQETDPALKRQVQLNDSQTFLSILPVGGTAVSITPFTTALIVRARQNGQDSGDFLVRFNEAKALFDTAAGFDVLTTIPANPTAPAADATDAQKQHALLLGGLANAVNNISQQIGLAAPNYEVIVLVTFDLVDGALDGMFYNQSLSLDATESDGTSTSVPLPTNIDFNAEMTRFRNNNAASYTNVTIPVFDTSGFANQGPTASAGADQTVARISTVSLDGSGTTDADSGVRYSWTQTAGTSVSLDNSVAQSPTFPAPATLLGSEVLSFTLTVTDPVGEISTDTVDITVNGAVPLTFLVTDEGQIGDGVGNDLDGGGKFVLDGAGNGTLLVEEGTINLTYTVTGDVLTTTFPGGFIIDDFENFIDVNGDSVEEKFTVTETAEFFELSLVEDKVTGDLFTIREVGTRSYLGIDTTETIADETYEFIDQILTFDYAQQIPFVVADGSSRSLVINAIPQFPLVNDNDELYLDEFVFTATDASSGTGTTVFNGIGFTYTLNADGHLSVVFANNETAEYYHLATRPTGDIVSVEYTLNAPFVAGDDAFIGAVNLSFLKDQTDPVPALRADVAGIYTGKIESFSDSTADDDQVVDLSVRLNPDGTGSVEVEIASAQIGVSSDQTVVFPSSLGVCWSLETDSSITINRAFSRDTVAVRSGETSTSFCSALTEENTDIQFVLRPFDIDGSTYKFIDKHLFNRCGTDTDPSCVNRGLDVKDFALRVTERVALTAVPPIAVNDFVSTATATAIVISPLSNDVTREIAIDASTVTIIRGPVVGTASVSATGDITYTPNAEAGQDYINYRVSDTSGNVSTIGRIDILVDPPVVVASDQTVRQAATVTLDASASTDGGSIVAYNWTQDSGQTVTLSDATSATPTFTAPSTTGITQTEDLFFTVRVTDNSGLDSFKTVTISLEPTTPAIVFSVQNYALPIQFGNDVAHGEVLTFLPDGTGNISNQEGNFAFTWTETTTTLNVDFSGIGGLVLSSGVTFVDVTGDAIAEEVNETLVTTAYAFALTTDGTRVDAYTRTASITQQRFNVTGNVALADVVIATVNPFQLFDVNKPLNLTPTVGEKRTLAANLRPAQTTLSDPTESLIDVFEFLTATTGTVDDKGETFTYSMEASGRLHIDFSAGDSADYYYLEERGTGSVIGSVYTYSDGSVRAFTNLSFVNAPAQIWVQATAAGVYESDGTEFLSFGDVASRSYYHLQPDGTGAVEFPVYSNTTGVLLRMQQSTFGICWVVDSDNDLIIRRTKAPDQRFTLSNQPSASHCSSVNAGTANNLVSFQRDLTLFDVDTSGRSRSQSLEFFNNCGSPVDAVANAPCTDTQLDLKNIFSRLEKQIAYVGTPGYAVADVATAVATVPLVINVLSNDIAGDSAFNVATVEVVGAPANGTTTVNATTGEITYTSNAGATSDFFYYRVFDANGNRALGADVVITF